MTMKVNDIPEGTEETPAMRLRHARGEAGLTRSQLASNTGIPAKSIEKFETGSQEPTLSRLKVLSKALNVTTQWIMGEEEAKPSKALSLNDNKPAEEPTKKLDDNPMDEVHDMLNTLVDMNVDEFDGDLRHAHALIDTALSALKHYEPSELLYLASERSVHLNDTKDAETILEMLKENFSQGQDYCDEIEERIVDTAVLGVDLYGLDRKALVDVAEELSEPYELEQPRFFGWGDHSDFVPLIRAPLRELAISGKGYDLQNTNEFPTLS